MSVKTARTIQNQSNPTTPLGATATYINVVHGRKMNPSNGHTNVENASSQRAGWASPQTMMPIPARAGPSS